MLSSPGSQYFEFIEALISHVTALRSHQRGRLGKSLTTAERLCLRATATLARGLVCDGYKILVFQSGRDGPFELCFHPHLMKLVMACRLLRAMDGARTGAPQSGFR
jgi:hypothetical protein